MAIPVNLNVNPAANGWIIFITPKFLENVGDRCYVASSPDELADVVRMLGQNLSPVSPYVPLEWPEDDDGS